MVVFGNLRGAQSGKQFGTDALKSLFQEIQTIGEGLILGQMRKPLSPIIKDKIVDLAFREFLVQVSEKPDADEFLFSKLRLSIIARAPETSCRTSILNMTDKQIKTD